jgi:hypothetical protein
MRIQPTESGRFLFSAETKTEESLLKILAKRSAQGKTIYFSKVGGGSIEIKIK